MIAMSRRMIPVLVFIIALAVYFASQVMPIEYQPIVVLVGIALCILITYIISRRQDEGVAD